MSCTSAIALSAGDNPASFSPTETLTGDVMAFNSFEGNYSTEWSEQHKGANAPIG